MDSLKTLPKDFIIITILKLLLLILGVITVGGLLVFASVMLMYLKNYSLTEVIIVGWLVWVVYLLIFAAIFYSRRQDFRKKTEFIVSLFNQKDVFLATGLFAVNNFLRKFRKE